MKTLYALILAAALTGCAGMQAHIDITTTDPATGVVNKIKVDSARRTAISTKDVTVITGQVLIDDDTVQVLGKTVQAVVEPIDK